MILDMNQNSTTKWIATVVASSDDSAFNRMIDRRTWNSEAIDFRILMNGIEFDKLDDFMTRLHEGVERMSAENQNLREQIKNLREENDLLVSNALAPLTVFERGELK